MGYPRISWDINCFPTKPILFMGYPKTSQDVNCFPSHVNHPCTKNAIRLNKYSVLTLLIITYVYV